MAVTNEAEFKVNLSAKDNVSGALKKTEENARAAVKGFESLEGMLVSVEAAVELAKRAFEFLGEKIAEVGRAYIAQESAAFNFTKSLQYSGAYSKEAAAGLTEFATKLSETNNISKDAALGFLTMGKQIGLTDDKVKALTQAAVDLSAGTGKNLSESFNLLMQTFHGSADGLKDIVPELRHVSTEALVGGRGLEIIAQRFKGAGSEAANTFGALGERVKNASEEAGANLGGLVVHVLKLDEAAKRQLQFWQTVGDKIKEFEPIAVAAADAFREALDKIDFKAIISAAEPLALILGVVFAPTLLPVITGVVAAVASLAAEFLLVPIGIIASAAALEIVFRNFGKLDEVGNLFGSLMLRVLANIRIAINDMYMAFMMGLEKLIEVIPGASTAFSGALAGIQKQIAETSNHVDDLYEDFNKAGKSAKESLGNLDTGVTGKALSEIKNLVDNTTSAFQKLTAAKGNSAGGDLKNLAPQHVGPVYEEELERIRRKLLGTVEQARTMGVEVSKIGLGEVDALKMESSSLLAELDKNYALMIEKGRLSTQQAAKVSSSIQSIRDSYHAKEVEAQRLASIEGNKLFHSVMDTQLEAMKTQLDEQVRGLQEANKKKLISNDEYLAAKDKLEKTYEEKKAARTTIAGQFTGGVDLLGGTADQVSGLTSSIAKLMSIIEGGSKTLINTIGAAFGPEGQAIAGIVNFFNQPPGKFAEMIQNTMRDFSTFLANIGDNIAKLTDKMPDIIMSLIQGIIKGIPKIISAVISTLPMVFMRIPLMLTEVLMSPSFWVSLARGIVKGIIEGIKGALGAISGMVKDIFSGKAFKGNFDVGSITPKINISSFRDAIAGASSNLFKVEDVAKAAGVSDVADRLRNAIASATEDAGSYLSNLWKRLMGTMKDIGSWVAGVWHKAWDYLKDIFPGLSAVWDSMMVLLQTVWGGLMNVFKAAWNAVKVIWGGLMDVLSAAWDGIISVFKGVWDAIKSIWQTLMDLFSGKINILQAAFQIGHAIFDAAKVAFEAVWNVLKTICEAAANAFEAVWNVLKVILDAGASALRSTWNVFKTILEAGWNMFLSVGEKVANFFRGAFDFLQTVGVAVASTLTAAWSALKAVWDVVLIALNGAWDALKIVWDAVLSPFRAVISFLKTTWDTILDLFHGKISIFEAIGKVFTSAFNAVIDTFKNVGKDVADLFSNWLETFKTIGLKIWNGLKDSIENAGDFIKGVGGKVWDGLKDALEKGGDFITGFGSKIWNGLKAGLGNAGDMFTGFGSKAWESLKSGLGNIGTVITDILGRLNPASLAERIFHVNYPEPGTVQKILGIGKMPFISFAQGGLVPGNAPAPGDNPINDRIVALLSPGEAIIPRSLMANAHIRSLVRAMLEGDVRAPGFSFGGDVLKGDFKAAGHDISQGAKSATKVAKSALEQAGDFLGGLDPSKVWDTVKEKALEALRGILEHNKFHTGGLVPSFSSGGEVPALLQPGEFVVNRQSVGALGVNALHNINSGNIPNSGNGSNVSVNLTVNTSQPVNDDFIRNRLVPAVKEAMRRASLNGEFTLAANGIRSV